MYSVIKGAYSQFKSWDFVINGALSKISATKSQSEDIVHACK